MRTLQITVLAAILLTGCKLSDASPPARESYPEGGNFTAGIVAILTEVEKCYLETPSKEIINFVPIDTSGVKYDFIPAEHTRCRVVITDLNQNDNGIWILHSVTTSGSKGLQSYNITVVAPTITSAPEDITTPTTKEPEVAVDNLRAQNISTTLGTNHTFIIEEFMWGTSERCFIKTPEGQRIDLKTLNMTDVIEVISYRDAACAINLMVKSDEAVGDWMLISSGTNFGVSTERRLPFSIQVEEKVNASVDEVTLDEGNDFYIRLEKSIPNFDTCRLVGPISSRKVENDERFSTKCGFIVKEVMKADRGTWKIQYGDKILYTARVVLNVNGYSTQGELPSLTWSRNDDINTTIGPEFAVFCKLESPSGRVVFDNFGRCRVVLDRVTMEHDGYWKMNVGVPGGVFTKNYIVLVKVVERAHDTPATTSVIANQPSVIITCNVTSRFPLTTCKFRNQRGEILLATEGVGQGRFTFHGNGSSYNNGTYSHECGFQITYPIIEDLGFWRCELKTTDAVHYGFLRVSSISAWTIRDPEVYASIASDPALLSSPSVESRSGSNTVLRCFVSAPLRYCFFRNTNGTVFNVVPTSPNYEGAGFPSGECGMRFPSLEVTDSGTWTCHVGIDNKNSIEELRTSIYVSIYDDMVARADELSGGLLVQARVHDNQTLEYCRFVRSDGLGFTSVSAPSFYVDRSDLKNGLCRLWVGAPILVDYRPWNVVAGLESGEEIARTASILVVRRPVETRYYGFSSIWLIVIATGIILIIVSAVIAPKSNRRWARERASALRNSFSKKPPPQNNQNSTACAA